MGKSSPPQPPDPMKTAAAQTATNIGTSVADNALNHVNQVTPDGSLTYSQTGSTSWTDPLSGAVYQLPQTTATQTLSKAQQAIKTQTDAAQLNLGTLANNQSGFLNKYMAKPFDGSNTATEQRLIELGNMRLSPMLAHDRESLTSQLSNQGIKLGSTAYDRAMSLQDQKENDARNSLILSGHGQAYSEGQSTRNQPINEITALLSGSQVSQPNYVNTGGAGVAGTDYAGMVQNNYNNKLNAWQTQQNGTQALLGGILGAGAKVGSAYIGANPSTLYSDPKLKTDVKKVAETTDKQNIYQYRYKAGGPMQLGLMADEVEKKHPEAVTKDAHGFRMVDYGKALSSAKPMMLGA